jgi:hypothetical protein|tara:strand:- start:23 stop:310 length:288 start_codon:yes stop_codon:yes gene_type:complete
MSRRTIGDIAEEISSDWTPRYPGNAYIKPMMYLGSIDDRYYQESARSIVLGFLSTAGGWRGDTARRVKAELRSILKLPKWEHAQAIDFDFQIGEE